MRTLLLINNLFLIFAFVQGSSHPTSASRAATKTNPERRHVEAGSSLSNMTVSLTSATDATILFKAQNEGDAPLAEEERIPHLTLTRNSVLTPGFERTLMVSVDNLAVPRSGLYARLIIDTQHDDPDLERRNADKIRVWQDTRFIPYSAEPEQSLSVGFTVVFQRFFKHHQRSIRTPTDYFIVQLSFFDPQGNMLHEIRKEHAFLMENQWRVPLPPVLEQTPGAAPNELVVYFCDMIPFQKDLRDPYTRIPRFEIESYVQTQLIPAMTGAFETQSNLWEMPWYEEWSNSRTDEDPKTLSVALGEKGTWFHGKAPSLGHAMISIRVDSSFSEYSDITDGIMSVFHHELFHNQQRNISLHFGSEGNLAGMDEAWKLFSEGTAVLASSVGQPEVQFEPTVSLRSYLKRANAFIGAEGDVDGGLNKRYKDVPYHTAIYWRFLYENCGGINHGAEDPAAGMKVIRSVLETLYKGEIANINSATEVADALPRIIDSALKITPSCTFQTYEESLVHFARALYMLRLEDGRCPESIDASNCGFFDPHHLYQTPHADAHLIAADAVTYINGSIPSSYGIDLIELGLSPALEAKSLQLTITNTFDSKDEFHVELWRIKTIHGEADPERWPVQIGEPASMRTENGSLVLEIANLDMTDFNGLGLIITRMDPNEDKELTGRYSIQLLVE